jgi:peptide/nickel transport system substrate-binding protein
MTRFARLLAVLLVALIGASAGAATFTYAAQADAVGLSPILTNDSVSAVVERHIYENLVKRDPTTNKLVPWLATSWDTPDATTWIFHLRQGVTFQDGTPFNAEAVKFTFERIMDPKVGAPRASLLTPVKSIDVVDDSTVKITTKAPYGAFLAALAHPNAEIVSPTAVKKYGDLMKNPVGTGPYMLKDWVSGDHITLVRNPNYWGKAPSIDTFVIRVVPDANTQVALLERGDVQLMDTVPPELVSRLQKNQNIEIVSKPGTPVYYLGFNYKKALWQNKTAREAIASAVNIDVISKLLQPLANNDCSIIGPQVFGYVEGVESNCTPYDPAKAKQLWSGLSDARPVTLWVPQIGDYPRVGQIIQGQLSQAGIPTTIKTVEWGAYLSATQKYEQDLYLLGWTNQTADGSELIYPNLDSANIGAANRSAYDNPAADKLIEASRATTDQQQRLDLLNQANTLLLKDVAWVTLYDGVALIAHRTNVSGITLLPTGDWSIANATMK